MNPPEPDFDDVPVRPPPGRAPFDGAPQPAQPGINGDPSIFPQGELPPGYIVQPQGRVGVELEFWNDYYNSLPNREDGMMKPCVMPRSITQRLEERINNLENSTSENVVGIPTPGRTELLEQRVKELEDRCKRLEERLVALETPLN